MEGDDPLRRYRSESAHISIHALRVEGDVRRRKTVEAVKISIHALRVEGDTGTYSYTLAPTDFYPRPPGGGRPKCIRKKQRMRGDFYPRPPGGGRLHKQAFPQYFACAFLSTPSGWRATAKILPKGVGRHSISIHALRVEGDSLTQSEFAEKIDFYPRPPGGGRHGPVGGGVKTVEFYTRPPGGGRRRYFVFEGRLDISIHALRVEGDSNLFHSSVVKSSFLSTPSGWRATIDIPLAYVAQKISIHALRVEGD